MRSDFSSARKCIHYVDGHFFYKVLVLSIFRANIRIATEQEKWILIFYRIRNIDFYLT